MAKAKGEGLIMEDEPICPPRFFCIECGEEVFEDESPGVWLHADTDEMNGRDIDAMHVAIPDTDDEA